MSLFSITDDRKTYGPLNMPDETCYLTDRQHKTLWKKAPTECKHHIPCVMGYLGWVNVHEAMPVCFG